MLWTGGPKADIVVPEVQDDGTVQATGFLASTAEEYAAAITKVCTQWGVGQGGWCGRELRSLV